MAGTTIEAPISGAATQRLFVALPVPPDAARTLAALPRRGLDAVWVPEKELHITLRFLGDVAAERVAGVVAALGTVRRPAFSVEIDSLGVFADQSPAILYARVASVRKVTTLCAEITDALTPLGFDFGGRAYVPHVTLARIRGGALQNYIQRQALTRLHWQAAEFALAESALAPEHPQRYRTLQRFDLR